MEQKKVLSAWNASGSDPSELKAIASEMKEATKTVRCSPGFPVVFYAIDRDANGEEVLLADLTDPLGGGGLDTYDKEGVSSGAMSGWEQEVKDEAFASRLFVSWPEKDEVFAYCEPSVMTNIESFVGLAGTALHCPCWAVLNACSFLLKNKGCTLVVREGEAGQNVARKVIAIRSLQYMPVDPLELIDVTERVCSNGDCQEWFVDNDNMIVSYAFEHLSKYTEVNGDKVKVVPKIRFSTSESGKGSIIWKLGWDVVGKRGNRQIYLAPGKLEVLARHRGTWNKAKSTHVVHQVEELFKKTEVLSERLDALEKEQIFFGEAQTVLANWMEDNKDFSKLVKKEIRQAIIEESETIFTDPVHTAAELALYLQGAADRITGLIPSTMHSIRQACGDFFYLPIRKDVGLAAK